MQTENEALQVLLDADIDKVMAGLDKIVEAAPSYKKLFSRWENQQWNSESFDFTVDREQWDGDTFTAEQRQWMEWSLSSFFLGEERVTTELLPFAIAAPSHEARAFLATQISDEAKHMVFFDRFYHEVLGVDAETLTKNVEAQRPKMNDEYRELFDGILHDCAETLRKDPSDMSALVRGITVYMVVIEGTLALTGARFIIRSLKQNDWLPGFRQGFTAVNRDESRHVGFGVKFLADAIKEDEAHKADHPGHAPGDAADRHARAGAADGRGPVQLRDAVRLHLGRDLRVRDEVAVEEARGDGDGARWRRGLARSAEAGPRGRPALRGPRADPRGGARGAQGGRLRGADDRQGRRSLGREQGADRLPLRLQAGARGGGRPRGRRVDHRGGDRRAREPRGRSRMWCAA